MPDGPLTTPTRAALPHDARDTEQAEPLMAKLSPAQEGNHRREPCSERSRVAANPCEQGAAGEVQKYTNDPAVADLLHDARDMLRRAEACDHWGVVAMEYAWQASVKLRAAGVPGLAAQCEDEWLFDAGFVVAEIEREMRG